MPAYESFCRVHKAMFEYEVSAEEYTKCDPPNVCGAMMCDAKAHWSIARWAAQLQMAEARTVAGVPESDLDAEARRRFGLPTQAAVLARRNAS